MAAHNKKRNVGLLYEFLVKEMSYAVVCDQTSKEKLVKKIFANRFKKGTEIHKEFKLFKALMDTTVESEKVAERIIESSKAFVKGQDHKALDAEKSLLIRDINHKIANPGFFSETVENYKMYATVQTLLNEWRKDSPSDLVKVAEYEQKLVEWLTQDKTQPEKVESKDEIDPLVQKIMVRKFNESFAGKLDVDQERIVKAHFFMGEDVTPILESVKKSTIDKIDQYIKESVDETPIFIDKIKRTKKIVESVDIEATDDCVQKFLDIAKLLGELK